MAAKHDGPNVMRILNCVEGKPTKLCFELGASSVIYFNEYFILRYDTNS